MTSRFVIRLWLFFVLTSGGLGGATVCWAQGSDELASVRTELKRLLDARQWAAAIPVAERRLALVREQLGQENLEHAEAMARLGALYRLQNRFADAEPLLRQALALRERLLGSNHVDVGNLYGGLAYVMARLGKREEAEVLYRRSLELLSNVLGPDHPDVSTTLVSLATFYVEAGRNVEAETLYKRALRIREAAYGPDHGSVAITLGGLAVVYQNIGRLDEALALDLRALEVTEKRLGAQHSDVGRVLSRVGSLLSRLERHNEAEPYLRRALAIHRASEGPSSTLLAYTLNAVALNAARQGRVSEAITEYREAIAIFERVLGADHVEQGTPLNNLAGLLTNIGRFADAEPIHRRVAAIYEKAYGPDDRRSIAAINSLGWMHGQAEKWDLAVAAWRVATERIVQRTRRGYLESAGPAAKAATEAERHGDNFRYLVKGLHRLALRDPAAAANLANEAFVAAQWSSGSEAGASVSQMAARHGAGDSALAGIVRERQDLLAAWHAVDKELIEAASRPTAQRDRDRERQQRIHLESQASQILDLDRRLAEAFPSFSALANPEPLSINEVQALLAPDEAFVLVLDTAGSRTMPEETFVWVVTTKEARWQRSELGSKTLAREVAALRCGLDTASWTASTSETNDKRTPPVHQRGVEESCPSLVAQSSVTGDTGGTVLPFDVARAHRLYRALFGEVSDLIHGKHLLVVSSGPLTTLPLHVLVTDPSEDKDYRRVRWLVRDHAVTALPSVSSFTALRRTAKPSSAQLPMIGFANPLLDGHQTHPELGTYYRQQAARASAIASCATPTGSQSASVRTARVLSRRSAVEPLPMQQSRVTLSDLRIQVPLPETADEVCAVARDLGADVALMRLGPRATETEVKAMSARGELARYRIVHFATHGTLAEQIRGSREPGLILTPPKIATELDDGYLSGSEITGLRLDADLVILSACNTAGPDGVSGAEALSGLARVFFYAGARALLVSHWEVDSDAAVRLITATARVIGKDKTVGRAAALRQAMISIIDAGVPHDSHPSYWAPFVIVGEGAAAR